ncbi:hypothetical protein Acor_36630 [Acrocarpospora corrugata]|uniref:Excalibur calcium-binding domain-containing protein n=1 Tax=Acrocarpospora corrugata TaxID=35763 RepID=A0A5M3W007_9ACTN|nr:hypothetical protein [Acrocarpospora corrugata]GES01599.1 hypothetical protein Acor_36630 [Acrocarpospora corrugata]
MRTRVTRLAVALTAAAIAVPSAVLFAAQASGAPDARPAPVVRATPGPHVLPFAKKLRSPRPRLAARPKKLDIPASIDGCDHAYGTAGQCVPWDFPKLAKGETRCDWIRAHKLAGITVNNPRDRHRLDPDRNGIACDS